MPTFRGGRTDSVMAYIRRTTRYPAAAIEAGATGKVFVTFVVNTQGQVEQVQVVKSAHAALDQEALRVISAMPASWQPGQHQGKPVAVALTVPISFAMLTAKPTPHPNAVQGRVGPTYPGGPEALLTYLESAPYPEAARAAQAEGRVFIKVRLNREGKVLEAKPFVPFTAQQRVNSRPRASSKEISQLLEQAALQWISAMPAWSPVIKDGVPITSNSFVLPVVFSLTKPSSEKIYPYAEQMPTFNSPNGLEANIQRASTYPALALRRGVQGVVQVYFVINEAGVFEQAEILSSPGPELSDSVLQAARKQLPAATPAMNQGKPVKVFYILPVSFAIK